MGSQKYVPKLLKILIYGHPTLRTRCEPVKVIDDEIRRLAADMIYTSDLSNGIGLAAPQVGYPIRMFVIRNYIDQPDGTWAVSEPMVFINPRLYNPSEETEIDAEGCLSLPGIRVDVERPVRITIEATNLDGEKFVQELSGLNARTRMHENDHINGVLSIDRATSKERRRVEPYLRKMKNSN